MELYIEILPLTIAGILSVLIYYFRIKKVKYPIEKIEDPPQGYRYFLTDKVTNSEGGRSRRFFFLNFLALFFSFGLLIQFAFLLWADFSNTDLPLLTILFWLSLILTLAYILCAYLTLIINWSSLEGRFRALFTRRNLSLLIITVLGLEIISYFILQSDLLALGLVVILAPAALLYSWLVGKFSILFLMQQAGVVRGFDPLDPPESQSANTPVKIILGLVSKLMAVYIIITIILSPFLALNSLLSLFIGEQQQGGFLGEFLFNAIGVSPITELIVLLIILGPLTAIALKPSGFLEQWLFSPVYNTLVNWDWEKFSLAIKRDNSILRLPAMSLVTARNTSLILSFFLAFAGIQAIAGIVGKYPIEAITTVPLFQEITIPLKLIETVFYLGFFFSNFTSLHEEKEFWNTMEIGRVENKDILNYRLWAMNNLSRQNYDPIIESSVNTSWNKSNFFPKFYAANAHKQKGNHEIALKLYEEILPYQLKNIEVLDNLAVSYVALDKNEEALELLKRSLKVNSKNALAYHNLGIIYNILGDNDLAEANFRRALELGHIRSFLSWQQLVDIFDRTDRLDEGIKLCLKGLKDNPDDWNLHGRLGYIYSRKLDYPNGLEAYQKAYELKPDDSRVIANLALTMDRLGHPQEEVLPIYEKSIEYEPDDALMNFNVGSYIARTGSPEKAISYLKKSRDLDPSYEEAWYNLAVALYQADHDDEAIETLEKMLESFPDIVKAYYLLGEVYFQKKNFEKALPAYQNVLMRDESHYNAFYRIGLIHARNNSYESAIDIWEAALNIARPYSGSVQILGDLGRAHLILGHFDEAEETFKEALEIDDSLVGLYYELAHVYALKGNFSECLNTLKHATSMSSDILPAIEQDSLFEKFRETEYYNELIE